MPAQNVLTVTKIDAARGGVRSRRLFDGGGLYLEVGTGGDKRWRLKYRIDGREKRISFGVYPDVSLKQARDKRDAARQQLADGKDPSAERQREKAARIAARNSTFEAVGREWYAKKSKIWEPSHAKQVLSRLENYVFRRIGSAPIASLTSPRLVDELQRMERDSSPDTAHRCLQYVASICEYAVETHRLPGNPTPKPGVLSPLKGGKFASITDAKGVGALMRAIHGYSGGPIVRAALSLLPLVFVRPGELRQAQWGEFDLDAREWRIPAQRMKMRKDSGIPHIVPLSRQSIEILREIHERTGIEREPGVPRFVFPSERTVRRPISPNTLNAALRSLGYAKDQIVAHGFRHMASTLLYESRKWDTLVIERQLAHADKNSIRSVYNAAEYIEERATMMQWWADHLDALAATANVVSLRAVG